MKLKEKISLEGVFGKEYKIRLVEPENNKEAIITHYLHNSQNGVSKFYKRFRFPGWVDSYSMYNFAPTNYLSLPLMTNTLKQEIENCLTKKVVVGHSIQRDFVVYVML